MCFVLLMPSCILAGWTFTQYNGHLLRLRKFGIVGADVVTSISKCKRYCLEHKGGCQAANVLLICKGVYSCELINDIALTTPVDLMPAEGNFFHTENG